MIFERSLRTMRLKILKILRIASLNLEFTGSYKKKWTGVQVSFSKTIKQKRNSIILNKDKNLQPL